MKTLLSGIVALTAFAALTAPAMAADIPLKARPAAVPQVFDWTGCYVGVHVGAGRQVSSLATQGGAFSGAGVLGGVQGGCNYQWRQFVIGLEGEFWGSSLDDRNQELDDDGDFSDQRSRNRWDAAISLRSGWAIDNLFIYGKLGVVFGRFDYTQASGDPVSGFSSTARGSAVIPGVLIGLGFEYGLTPNWTAKFEYNYIDYGNKVVDLPALVCDPAPDCITFPQSRAIKETKQIAKLGLNYKFGGSGPMSAMAAWPATASSLTQTFDWTGCYVGVHGGAGWQASSFTGGLGQNSGIGGLGGVQAGCNYQLRRFVIGLEGEVWGSSLYDRSFSSFAIPANFTQTIDSNARNTWDVAVSVRAGVAFDRAFLYGKLGGVWGRFEYDSTQTFVSFSGATASSAIAATANFAGILIGAGFEYALTNKWTTKFEYNYIDFGNRLVDINGVGCNGAICNTFTFSSTVKEIKQIAKVGLNYKFGEPSGAMSAMAASLPVKAAPPVQQVFDWTGCYVGIHAGGGWQSSSYAGSGGILASGVGALGGGQAGCNYQWRQFVIGVEGEVWTSSLYDRDEGRTSSFSGFSESRNVWDVALSVRSGVALERAFIYGKLGVVWGRFDYSSANAGSSDSGSESGSAVYPGVLIGVGVEYALTDQWTAKFEYNYIDYGNRSVAFNGLDCDPDCVAFRSTDVLKETKQLAKLGLNYKFSGSGAMSAMAAAIPVKAAAPMPRVFDWTGCYVGVHAGAGWQGSSFASETLLSGVGALGGGQAGCSYQWKQFVIGLEGEFWGSSLYDRSGFSSSSVFGSSSFEANSRNRWDGGISARAGYAFERTFVYGKLGGVWGRFDYDSRSFSTPSFTQTTTGSATFAGVLIGVGFEYALTENWTTKFEYNYIDYGHALVDFSRVACNPICTVSAFSETQKEVKQLAKVGVNYKFTGR
jgi:outer membrane immunogenic protein